MLNTENKARIYFSIIVAALVTIALIVGNFIYNLLNKGPEETDLGTIIYTEDGTPGVNPNGAAVPSGPPHVPAPTSQPPR